jgi:hypothetical protein
MMNLLIVCAGLSTFVAAGGEPMVDSDFAQGDFAALGWKVDGAWDLYAYPAAAAHDPGRIARFAAHKPAGSLTRDFAEIPNPRTLTLSLDYGWGWGDANQGADSVSFLLLDAQGRGYAFKFHRCKANWAVQWGRAADGKPPQDMTWAQVEIDATRAAVRDGGGLMHVEIRREADATWSIRSKDWNQGRGASVWFHDATISAFSRLVLLGTENFDEQVFNHVVVQAESRKPTMTLAVPTSALLSSIGIVTSFPDRGQPLPKTIDMIRYCGFRWVRAGIEGVQDDGPTTMQTFLDLHRATGVRFSWGLVSGGSDVPRLIKTAKVLAQADALLALEGNNEPNNWGVQYQGEQGGGSASSWLAVAKLQRDLYRCVKDDPELKKYPVWSISEAGAQRDNVGLQYLTVPPGAGALMPDGTQYADFVNVHNYIYHPNSAGVEDNKAWNAADPTAGCQIDGLYGNHGVTWGGHFRGYSEDELQTLPRVTTETGTTIGGAVTEEIHAVNLVNMYLSQYKRGWSYTAVYLLRDRTDEGGNQGFGFFAADYRPRKAAIYLHNLTTILADKDATSESAGLSYSIPVQPGTVHDLLLRKSDGTFQLIVWGERVSGADEIAVELERPAEVTIYDPTVGTEMIEKAGNTRLVKLHVADHPIVLVVNGR